MIKRLALFCLALLFVSCGTERLTVQSEYLVPDRYASVWVGTPDPHKVFPDVGQRLIIKWKLRPEMEQYGSLILKVCIRFRNYETYEKSYRIKCPVGRMIYNIMNDDYTCTQGIGAYTVEIHADDGTQIATIRHHLWRRLIVIDDEDEFEGEPDDFPEEFDYTPDFREGESFYRI